MLNEYYVEDTNCIVKLFYIHYRPNVVFTSSNGKVYTRRCIIVDRELQLCKFRFRNKILTRRFF